MDTEQHSPVDVDAVASHDELIDALQQLRRASPLTYRKIAALVDRPHSTISGWFTGKHLPYPRDNDIFEEVIGHLGVLDTRPWMSALERVRDRTTAGEVRWPIAAPPPVAGMVGRSAEHADLDRSLLGRGGTRRVVVHGLAGVGKSAIAITWLWRRRDRFPDGSLFVELRGGSRQPTAPDAAIRRILRFLGDEPPATDDPDVLIDRFRATTAGRRFLLVLDDAAGEQHVRPLLPSGGACLITSRSRLSGLTVREGIDELWLPPLAATDGAALLAAAGAGDLDPAASALLTDACGGLPLGLRLVAQLIPSANSPDEVVRRIHRDGIARSLDIVTDDVESRLSPLFEQTVAALSPGARRTLGLIATSPCETHSELSVGALAGVSRAAATELVEDLTRANLLIPAGHERFTMHDLLQAWLRERPRAESLDANRRLRRFYVHALDRVDRVLLPARDRAPLRGSAPTELPEFATYDDARLWGEAELDSLVAVVADAVGDEDWPTIFQIPHIALSVLNLLKPWEQWLAMFDLAATHIDQGSPVDAANISNGLGIVRRETGHPAAALEEFARAAAGYQAAGERGGLAMVYNNIALCHSDLGDQDGELTALRAGLAVIGGSGDDFRRSILHHNLAEALLGAGGAEAALAEAGDAHAAAQRAHDVGGAATALTTSAAALVDLGRPDEAMSALRSALTIQVELADEYHAAFTRRRLAKVLDIQGLSEEAAAHLSAATNYFATIGDETELKRCLELADSIGQARRPEPGANHPAPGTPDDGTTARSG